MRTFVNHWLLGLTLTVLPLTYWEAAIDPVLLPSFCFLSLGLVAILIALVVASRKNDGFDMNVSVWKHPIILSFIAYWMFVALSLFQAINISEAVFELARVSIAGVLLLTYSAVASSAPGEVRRFTVYATGICMILTIIGFCQLSGVAFTFLVQHGVPAGTFANRGLFISYLCMLLPFAVLGATSFGKAGRTVAAIVSIATLLLIVLSENRSSWVALISATLFLLTISLRRIGWRSHKSTVILGGLIVVIFGAAIAFGGKGSALIERAKSIVSSSDESKNERLMIWSKTSRMFWDNALTGVGAGNCKIVFPAYGIAGTQQESGDIFFQRPHNDYLWVASETGILGLVAYLLFFGFVLKTAFVEWRRPSSVDAGRFATAALFAITCFAVDSIFSFPKERITHLAILMLIAGLMIGQNREHRTRRRTAVFIILAFISAGALAIGWIRLRSEIDTKAALLARERNDWPAVISEIAKARSPFATLDPTSTPLAWYSGVAHYSLGEIDDALADFEVAYTDNPNHIHVLNNLATCYELKGEHGKAIDLYTRLLQMHPNFLEARLNLAAVDYNVGEFQEAADALAPIDSNCSDAKYLDYREKIAVKLAADSAGMRK